MAKTQSELYRERYEKKRKEELYCAECTKEEAEEIGKLFNPRVLTEEEIEEIEKRERIRRQHNEEILEKVRAMMQTIYDQSDR